MKRFLIALFAVTVGLGLTAHDAEAKRLGGGKSFGMNRDAGTMRQASPAPTSPTAPAQNAVPAKPAPAATPQAPAPQPSGMSRWLGPIAGIAAGIGLAALLSHFGLGEGFASILMLALLVFAAIFVVRLLFRKSAPQGQMQYAGAGGPAGYAEPARFEPTAAPAGGSAGSVPAGFDSEGFLRQAKLNFIRLQAANDAGNMEDVANFTSPEMFAEIKMQYEERGRNAQRTDVVQLNAELLDVNSEAERHVASVRFFGQIREEERSAPEAFDEVWHLTKPAAGDGGWVVAGIQQAA